MARTTETMENRKIISSGGEVNNMQRSKLRRDGVVNLRRIIGGLVNDQINSRSLMHNRQINDRDELQREKEELNTRWLQSRNRSRSSDLINSNINDCG
jgi:hypothetical protein